MSMFLEGFDRCTVLQQSYTITTTCNTVHLFLFVI